MPGGFQNRQRNISQISSIVTLYCEGIGALIFEKICQLLSRLRTLEGHADKVWGFIEYLYGYA